MKLLYEEELNYRRWCTRLLQLTWWFVALVTLAEAVLLAVDLHANGTANIQHELYVYLLRPSLVYIVLLGIVQLATRPLLDKKKYVQQAVLYLVAISLAVLVLAWTHYAVPVVYIMFAFPIFLSVVYAQHWLTTCAFLLNLLLFGVLVLALPPLYPDGDAYLPDAMNSITTVAMLCGAFLAARLLISRQKELAENINDAHLRSKQDSLTGLYNHAAFYDELDEAIICHNATGQQFCLVILDIDNFKRINDQFGHAVGDVVITTLVSIIKGALAEGDRAFRYGGEEFTILTNRPARECVDMANTILNIFRTTLSDPSWGHPVTVSAGVCAYDAKRFGAKREFFAAADEALYEAKRTGKDKTVIWTQELSRRWGAFATPHSGLHSEEE